MVTIHAWEHRGGGIAPHPGPLKLLLVYPRPGSCAGVGGAALFSSSRDLPDDVLTFIKAHPLLDPAVPPATHQPLLTLTSRYGQEVLVPFLVPNEPRRTSRSSS